MALEIIEPARDGFGADRFVVRNGARERDALAQRLRPFIVELPERLVDPSRFPQPGRRGPSRVSATFPSPVQTRQAADDIVITREGVSGLIGTGEALPCVASETRSFGFTVQVTTGLTVLLSTTSIPYPFLIKHIMFRTHLQPATNIIQGGVFVAPGVGITDVESPNRKPVTLNILNAPGQTSIGLDPTEFYPAFPVTEPDFHIQISFTNTGGATSNIVGVIEIERLG